MTRTEVKDAFLVENKSEFYRVDLFSNYFSIASL